MIKTKRKLQIRQTQLSIEVYRLQSLVERDREIKRERAYIEDSNGVIYVSMYSLLYKAHTQGEIEGSLKLYNTSALKAAKCTGKNNKM